MRGIIGVLQELRYSGEESSGGGMAVYLSASEETGAVTITVTGRFQSIDHMDFLSAYESIAQLDTPLTLDLSSTVYLDSAALGMLLAMREHFGGDKAKISIVGCNDQIKRILNIAHFSRLFDIP